MKNGKVKNTNIYQRNADSISSGIKIVGQWNLPAALKEVSGIAYIDDQRFACIQDEAGIIYIYNVVKKRIERKIRFAKSGDFEGIAIKNNSAFVVRADGKLFEVEMSPWKVSVYKYRTTLTAEQNIEGLCYDRNNDRLLLAIKDHEPSKMHYKGIYEFDLVNKTLIKEPVFKIDLKNKIFNNPERGKNKPIRPSEIDIHPVTNEIFITDGPGARLLIMDSSGIIKKLYQLGKGFCQPEGITFSPDGEVFISNEGRKQAGNICRVEIQE